MRYGKSVFLYFISYKRLPSVCLPSIRTIYCSDSCFSCSSLGMPIHLTSVGQHSFARYNVSSSVFICSSSRSIIKKHDKNAVLYTAQRLDSDIVFNQALSFSDMTVCKGSTLLRQLPRSRMHTIHAQYRRYSQEDKRTGSAERTVSGMRRSY